MDTYIVFDLETTTRIPTIAEIIEIAAIKVIDGNIVDEFNSLVKPNSPIDPAASAVNGITDDMVRDASSLRDILPSFLEFIGDNILIGYNNSTFDIPILRRELKGKLNTELHNDYADVLLLARERLPFLPNRRLTTVAAYFGISPNGAHRALKDCYLTKECYEKLLELSPCESQKPRAHRKYSSQFSDRTKALQTLQGFLLEVVADNVLTESEVLALKNWLDDNKYLAGQYPFDRVFSVIETALADGILEQSELDEMLDLFKKFTSPADECACAINTLELSNKNICLTGDFEHGSRKDIETMLCRCGCSCQSAVSGKTNYVVVGALGSPDWSHGNYGSKIKRALELQEKGNNVQIVKESDFFKILSNMGVTVNEPLTLSDTAPKAFIDRLHDVIGAIIAEYELPEDAIFLFSNTSSRGKSAGIETSKSLCLYEPEYPPTGKKIKNPDKNYIVLRIADGKDNSIDLAIRNIQFHAIQCPDTATIKATKSDKGFIHIIFEQGDPSIYQYIHENIIYCLENYTSRDSFACCGKYVTCSDAKQCLHENKMYAMKCKYRKNLEAGRIFYGVNKNI